MTEEERKRGWQYLALALVGGGVALAGWAGLMRPAGAEPIPKLDSALGEQPAPDAGSWTRSTQSLSQVATPAPGTVVQTAGMLPLIPSAPLAEGRLPECRLPDGPIVSPLTPAIPQLVPVPVLASDAPVSSNPGPVGCTIPQVGVSGSMASQPQVPIPTIPVMPVQSLQALPQPVASGVQPQAPALPLFPLPAPTPLPAGTPSLSIPSVPAITPPVELAPSPPALQFPDTIQPVMPVGPDSRLQSGNEGINVKPGTSTGTAGPVPPLPGMPSTTASAPGVPASFPQTNGNPFIPLPPGAATGTVVDRPKPNEDPWPHSEKDTFSPPSPNGPDRYKTSGETTMLKQQQQAAALAILGGMFLIHATPATANSFLPLPAANTPVKDEKAENSLLKFQIEQTNEKLATIQKQLASLTEMINGKKDPAGLNNDPGILYEIKKLKERLEIIERDLTKFNNQTSSSLRPPASANPINPIIEPKPVALGTLRIVNDYPVEISMVINGEQSYKIGPAKAVDIRVPAGDFTYQLVQSGAPPTRSFIKDKEMVTLRIK